MQKRRSIIIATAIATLTAGAARAECTAADVEALQTPLLAAVAEMLQTDAAGAQALVADLQIKMAAAAEAGDEEAPCIIFQDALDQITK